MPRPRRDVPADLVPDWPQQASADPDVEVARLLALNLASATAGQSLRPVGAVTKVDHTTVSAIIRGLVCPDLQTLARLEAGLGVDLWPSGVARTTTRTDDGAVQA